MAYNINQPGINQSKKFRYALSDYTEFHFGITSTKIGISTKNYDNHFLELLILQNIFKNNSSCKLKFLIPNYSPGLSCRC
jgi:hypothetical protein